MGPWWNLTTKGRTSALVGTEACYVDLSCSVSMRTVRQLPGLSRLRGPGQCCSPRAPRFSIHRKGLITQTSPHAVGTDAGNRGPPSTRSGLSSVEEKQIPFNILGSTPAASCE